MKREIKVFDYAGEIAETLQNGVLLTTEARGRVNAMTVSWGMLGIEWGKPVFTVFVRENRFTKKLLDENPEFTVNIPYGKDRKKILGYCGAHSGRDVDKIKEAGLTLVPSDEISVPCVEEFPLTLECRVVYKQKQDADAMTAENYAAYYPQNIDGRACGRNRDCHTAYYGEIVKAYIIEK
jgi:flavin reductase (DIM6/NTAB) family NADH-FMN oxidoreductase RutF